MEERRRLESCEMWQWRKLLGILWSHKISNEEGRGRMTINGNNTETAKNLDWAHSAAWGLASGND